MALKRAPSGLLVCEGCARASQMLVQRSVIGDSPRLCVACDFEARPGIEGLWSLARMYRDRADEERWPGDMRSWLEELVEWAAEMQPDAGSLPN